MKIRFVTGILILGLLFFAATAAAVPKGKELSWESSEGTVVFSGKSHAEDGLKCRACHNKLFKRKYGTAEMTMKELNEGKYCGACHNGKQSFNTTDKDHCMRCHAAK